jgi:hypothetical protein
LRGRLTRFRAELTEPERRAQRKRRSRGNAQRGEGAHALNPEIADLLAVEIYAQLHRKQAKLIGRSRTKRQR